MKHLIILAMSGALGTVLRYQVLLWVGERSFPWGVFWVNVIGSFLMGFFYVLFAEKALLDPALKPYVMTAFLGAFTTFSAFSLDVFRLIETGEFVSALAYVLASVFVCVAALAIAVMFGRIVL